ncbi:MAG: hypothetical protein EU531_07135 [Promethearchaeota archaeon]|nr:MAG: hypothetical protein EU531_07135 [Candidatus Lokiarchaeota archaeon]
MLFKRRYNPQDLENKKSAKIEDISKEGRKYYISQKSKIIALFEEHAQNWKPILINEYGEQFTNSIMKETLDQTKELILKIPYIGGDDNSMTYHLIRATPSLALYKVMKAYGKTARETGKIVYKATLSVIEKIPFSPAGTPPQKFIQKRKEEANKSQERRYPGDWVWKFIEGEKNDFDYGYDFYECGVQKYYKAQDAEEFLPYFCFLDFVTVRASGKLLMRSMTLAEGGEKCDFRFRSAENNQEWPPPFI